MKTLAIALKDTLTRFRDRNAILLMIAAPLLISLVMGAAFGGQGAAASPISEIPLIIVNADEGGLGADFAAIYAEIQVDTSEGEKPLFTVTAMTDKDAALEQVELGKTRGVVHIPAGFSARLQAAADPEGARSPVVVEVYTDPAANVSPAIIRGVTSRIANGFSAAIIGSEVAVAQLTDTLDNAAEPPSPEVLAHLGSLDEILRTENAAFGESQAAGARIAVSAGLVGESEDFNPLNYFVPSMAIFFLMFGVFNSTQSILEEERDGTLHRMMTTPTGRAEILLGKISGAFLTGILQFVVLVLVSGLVFRVDWGGDPLAITLLVLGTVVAATSLGTFVASFARSVSQAAVLGSVITLVSAILGGNFIDFRALPEWLVPISKLTINRWAMEGFFNLMVAGLRLPDILPNVAFLFGLGAVFFTLALALFNRRFVK
jgi:ABC-2 type transport system permease protein